MDQSDKQLWDLLGSAKRHDAPSGFASSVMQRIMSEEQEVRCASVQAEASRVSLFEKFRHFKHSYMPWASAASAAALVCILLVISKQSASTPSNLASVEIDDQILLDLACNSLGDEDLQDAVYQIASVDSPSFADADLAELLLDR